MSQGMALRIVDYLKLSHREASYLSLLIQKAAKERSENRNEKINNGRIAKKDLDHELAKLRKNVSDYHVVSEKDLLHLERWTHTPLLELIHNLGKNATSDVLASCLEGHVSVGEVEKSLLALKRMGLVEKSPAGFWVSVMKRRYFRTPIDVPSTTVRNAHRQIMKRAGEALEEQSVLDREFLTKALTIRADRIAEAKRRIREVIEELTEEFIETKVDSEGSEVYQLSLQFFRQARLSNIDSKK